MKRMDGPRRGLFIAASFLLAALAGGVSAQTKKSAQAAQTSVFACLPKAERAKAEKLLAACVPAYARASEAAKATFDPVFGKASQIVALSAGRRLTSQGQGLGIPGESSDPGKLVDPEKLALSLEKDCEAAQASLKGIAPPEEAKALAALLRSKASKNDSGSLAKAENAVISCFPAKQRSALRELGARFKSGGAAAYIAYLSCVCESFLIDPEPFERLAKAEAASLNDSAAAKAAIKRIVSALSVQRSLLARPCPFAYPPSLTAAAGGSGDAARREGISAFFTLAGDSAEAWRSSPWFLDEGIASWMAECSAFLPVLPDAELRRLEDEAGRKLADGSSIGDGEAFSPDEADLRRALGLIQDFETANSGTDAAEASRTAFAMLADRSARLLLGSTARYVAQRDACVGFLKARLESLAAIAYPGKAVAASVAFEGDALGAVVFIEDPAGKGTRSFVNAGELAERLKGREAVRQDLPALGFLVRYERIVSLIPLRFLDEYEASAFAWRCLAYGGKR